MNNFTVWRAFALASQFGISLGVFTGLGVYVGEQLDYHFQATPVFTLVCIFLGLALGTWSGIQWIRLSLDHSSRKQ